MRYGTAVILVITAGVLWSLQGLVFRQIETAGSWAVLFWRSVGMVPVLVAFLVWRSGRGPVAGIRALGLAGVSGGMGLVCAFGGAIYSIQTTTIANAVFLFAAAPFLTALLGWAVLRERVHPRTWATIAIALFGIWIMVQEGLKAGSALGNAAALLSAAGFAVFTVSLRWRRIADTLPAVLLGGLFSIAIAAIASAATGDTLQVPWQDACWAIFMGAVTLTGGMILYTLGARVVPAAELALLSGIEVILAPLWVWLFLGETASLRTLLGGMIILSAVVLNGLSASRRTVRG